VHEFSSFDMSANLLNRGLENFCDIGHTQYWLIIHAATLPLGFSARAEEGQMGITIVNCIRVS
jgi:hypothetical protein